MLKLNETLNFGQNGNFAWNVGYDALNVIFGLLERCWLIGSKMCEFFGEFA